MYVKRAKHASDSHPQPAGCDNGDRSPARRPPAAPRFTAFYCKCSETVKPCMQVPRLFFDLLLQRVKWQNYKNNFVN